MNDVPFRHAGFADDRARWPAADTYISQTIRLRTRLDQTCFAAALRRILVERHASRPWFRRFAAPPPPIEPFFEYHDFSQYPDPEAASRAWIEDRLWQPLTPEDAPPDRFAVAKVGEDDFVWARTCHQAPLMPNSAAKRA